MRDDAGLGRFERLVKVMIHLGYDRRRLDTLTEGVALLFNIAIFRCRKANSARFSQKENMLIGII